MSTALSPPRTTAKGIQSVDTAFGLLQVLGCSPKPMTLKDVAAQVDMSASKTRMYMVSLLRTGMVVQNAAGAYTLGPAVLNLGLAAFNQMDLIESARTLMAELATATQGPTMLSIWNGTAIMIIARGDSLDDLPIDFRIGGSASLANTATGRVFQAYLPEGAAEASLVKEFSNMAALGQKVGLSLDEVRARVTLTRQRGYDVSDEVMLTYDHRVVLNGYGAIAVPIIDLLQELRFVVTVLYRKSDAEQEGRLIAGVLKRIRETLPTPLAVNADMLKS